MRIETEITCPLSGGKLIHTGASSNGYTHFYESSTNKGIRYRRYRLDWGVLELKGGNSRHFHINGNEAIEVHKVGDKWLTLTATEEEKQLAMDEHSKRMKYAFENMEFPTIKNVASKLVANDIIPMMPDTSQRGKSFHLQHVYNEPEERNVTDPNARPNVSVDVCPLVEYVTGRIGHVNTDNIDKIKDEFKDEDIQIGDTIYEWDMGGWTTMSGRAGEAIFRDDEYITSRLTKMS